jgi:hypothetical protein
MSPEIVITNQNHYLYANLRRAALMRKRGLIVGALVMLVLSLPALVLAQTAMLWDGTQWQTLPREAKIGYIKGVGNLADYEMAASGKHAGVITRALMDEWRTKTIDQVVKEIDKFYKENPRNLSMPVIEVMIRCCSGLNIPPHLSSRH